MISFLYALGYFFCGFITLIAVCFFIKRGRSFEEKCYYILNRDFGILFGCISFWPVAIVFLLFIIIPMHLVDGWKESLKRKIGVEVDGTFEATEIDIVFTGDLTFNDPVKKEIYDKTGECKIVLPVSIAREIWKNLK